MMNFLSNFAGHNINPACETHRMVAASGQKLTATLAATDYTVTVVAGARYAITADKTGVLFLGVAAITTDANILWTIGANGTLGIEIPAGITTLHYGSDTNATIGRLSLLDDTQ
jgi:hypothetical protein